MPFDPQDVPLGEVQRALDATITQSGRNFGVITATGHGYVDFAIPFLREYLREHAALVEMTVRPWVT